jgi:hypothetical protein
MVEVLPKGRSMLRPTTAGSRLQNGRFIRKMILNGLTPVVAEQLGQKWQPRKEKREQGSRTPNVVTTGVIIPNG